MFQVTLIQQVSASLPTSGVMSVTPQRKTMRRVRGRCAPQRYAPPPPSSPYHACGTPKQQSTASLELRGRDLLGGVTMSFSKDTSLIPHTTGPQQKPPGEVICGEGNVYMIPTTHPIQSSHFPGVYGGILLPVRKQ